MADRVYLDWNATAPLRPEARDAMIAAMDVVGNPSSVHAEGRAAKSIVEKARGQVADATGASGADIVFTSSATEASALALSGRKIKSAATEHDCVSAWTDVSLKVARTGLIKVEVPSVSAHKLGGPKGCGALIIRQGIEVPAQILGGGQEMGRRSGTENVIGIAGFGAAIEAAGRDLDNGEWDRVAEMRDAMEAMLLDAAPELIVFGRDVPRLPNTSNFAIPHWKGETQVMQMDLSGFAVSAGSACSSGKVKESRVLKAMGYDSQTASSAIRVSMGPTTTQAEVTSFADVWIDHYRRFKQRAA